MESRKKALGIGGGGPRERRGSVGNIEEMMKRKREERKEESGEGEDIFRKSRKTGKSPE